MTNTRIELVVLDVHGVVLNVYWPSFLREIARDTGQPADVVARRWHTSLRSDTWLGKITDRQLWQRLTGLERDGRDWRQVLEAGYTRGPAAPYVRRWAARVPIWLLSNHRTSWLLPRLARFDLLDCFDCILVSDALGAMKPDPAAFREIRKFASAPERVLFVDDQLVNVRSAGRLGFLTLYANDAGGWPDVIDRLLDLSPAATPG